MNEKPITLFNLLVFGIVVITAYLLITEVSPVLGKNRFEPWDEAVFAAVAEDHGEEAANRLRKVTELIIANQDLPVKEKLELVNDYMNALPWIADPQIWKREDYWATAFETLTTFGGDCEDIAIAKYVVLRLMGISDRKLGFVYVQTSNKERHMVLAYKDSPDTDPVILDNQHPDVVPSKKRRDIIAIYAFKNDGTLFVIEDDGKNDRKLKAKIKDKRLAKWASAKERSKKNIERYEKYNGGRPLVPEWVTDK